MLFVMNWLRNSGKMKGYPDDIWTVRIWTVKFPGDIWTVEIWTVKTGLGLLLELGFLLRLDLGLRLVLGFELVCTLGLGLGLVMTVQFMTVQILTVQIKTGNYGTVSSPHFWPMSIVVKRLDGMDQDAIWYGGTSRPRPHCVRWEPSSSVKGHSSPLNFRWCLLWPSGWMDQNATWYGGRPQRRRHCVR